MIGKYYLAAKLSLAGYLREVETRIQDTVPSSECTSRWIHGGEDGLAREQVAILDLDDVDKADTVILFTHERGTPQPGGGRFIEFGYALGKGKRCIAIGPYENVFMHHPDVTVYEDLTEFLLGECE